MPLSPHANRTAVAQLSANRYQNAARKPSMSASGLSFSWYRELLVMLVAITPLQHHEVSNNLQVLNIETHLVASPTDLPI